MKALRKILVILVGLLIVLCVVGALLPRILSLSGVRKAVLRRLNRESTVTVAIDDWRLRWRGGLRFVGLQAETGDGQVVFKAQEITASSGLLDLLGRSKDLGTVRVVVPDARLAPVRPASPGAEVPSTRVSPDAPDGIGEPPTRVSPQPPEEGPPPSAPAGAPKVAAVRRERRLPEIKGTLVLSDGRLVVAPMDASAPLVLQEVNAEISIDGLDSPIGFDVRALQPSGASSATPADGRLSAKGRVVLFREGLLAPNRAEGNIELSLNDIDAGPFAAAAGEYGELPGMEGTVTGKARLSVGSDGALGLAADLSASRVALSGGPFGDDKPQFDRVVLGSDVVFAEGKMAFERFVLDSPLGHVGVAGELGVGGGNALPVGHLAGEANLDLAELARAFPGTLKVREDLDVTAGSARIEGEATADADGLRITALARVRDLKALKGDEVVALESPVSVLVRGRRDKDGVLLESLQAEGSFGSIRGRGTSAHVSVTADLDVGKAMAEVGQFVDLGVQQLGGRLKASLTADLEAEPQQLGLNAVWADLDYKNEALHLQEREVTLDIKAVVAGEDLGVQSLDLTSEPLSVSCSGSVTNWPQSKALHLSGTLTPDFERLAALGLVPLKVPVALSGRSSSPFKLHTELGCADKTKQLLETTAEADLSLDRLTVVGIDASNVALTLKLNDGKLATSLHAQVNEGRLSAAPVFHLGGESPVMVLAGRTPFLTGVLLTDAMMSEVMSLVNPVLRTSGVVTGSVDMVLEPCRLTLDKRFAREATFSGSVGFTDVVLSPSGSLLELLDLLHVEPRDVAISNQTVVVACKSGLVESTPLYLSVESHRLSLSGSVGLDGRLRYMAKLPVTRKLVGSSVYDLLGDIELKLPIGGTIAKPDVSKKAFSSLVNDLIKDSTKKIALDQGQELLQKLFKKLDDRRPQEE